jgi:hypothetical protein
MRWTSGHNDSHRSCLFRNREGGNAYRPGPLHDHDIAPLDWASLDAMDRSGKRASRSYHSLC